MRVATKAWTTRFARLLLLLTAAAAGLSQGENDPYFSLSSRTTFGSKGKPTVMMSAWNVEALEFRVYRIADPLKFFEQIEDPHQFGGSAPRPAHERTWIERIHSWKLGFRANIRRGLRAQFTESPSAHFESAAARQGKPVSREAHFAEAPLLNSQQLVLSFLQPVRSHARWEMETVPLEVKDKGVYLVEAVHGDLRAYTVLMVSDIVMITKSAQGRLVNLIVNRANGEPLPDAKVWMVTHGGEPAAVVAASTDASGFAELPLAGKRVDDVRLVARNGSDFAVNALAGYAFGANNEQWQGYFYTDRPVYRPGHTVHFKGILRLRTASGYQAPAGRQIAVEIHDSDQKAVYRKTLTASANGTIHDEFALEPSATLGPYMIEAKAGEAEMNGDFDVEEYKKPEFEVRVLPAKQRVLEGESVPAVIDSRYYFGEPVNGAKVTYAVYRSRYWFPYFYDPEEGDQQAEGGGDADDADDAGDQLNQGEGQLDADGKMTITVQTSVSDHKFDYRYRIEARVTDQSNREIVGKGNVIATYASFLLNVTPDRYFYQPGGKGSFQVDARDYDNQPVHAGVHVEMQKYDSRHPANVQVKAATDVDTAGDGTATAHFDIPAQGGEYRVAATARTPEGRDVEEFSYLWIAGGNSGDFGYGANNRNIQIVSDRKTYRAGDTAKLLVMTGRPNTPVYLTVEGRDLRQYRMIRSEGSTATFELPVAALDEPGITVNASFIRNGNFYNGSKYVRVPPLEHQMNVALATDKPQYLPGETAQYSIVATGTDGKPVPRAEFSLGVVDEAIYAIRPDSTEPIVNFFFGREWNTVFTENSLNYYFNGEAGKKRMRLAEFRPASRLAQLKPDRLVQPKIRKAFPDTTFWATDLVTDSAGRAQAKVEFPDSLTTWRATARGVTADTKVGSGVLKTIVRKNLILRLAVPRFFVQGDEVVISALVHNYLSDAKTARVSLDVTGLDILEGATKDVEIPSRGDAKVDWRVRAQQVRKATVLGKALTDEESDALSLDLPVNVPGVKLALSRGGVLTGSGDAAFDLTFPAKIAPGSRTMAIGVSPSIAGSLFGALEYLTSFPYGCVEQTMSSFLPDIIVTQAVRDLELKANLDQAALGEKTTAGLQRLYDFQHDDGGWGWWQTDETHPFMTAYVVAGLAQAQAAGITVKPEAVQKGAAWLKADFVKDPKLAADLRAYMAYSLTLAGQADATTAEQIYDKRANLSPYGLAILGLMLEQAKDGRAADIAGMLEKAAQQDQEQAWWQATRDEMLDFSADVSPEATAYAVKFLSHERKDSPLLPKAALWLMNHRYEGFWWSSTKQTAMVIYGLIDYLKYTNELHPDLNVIVSVNGQPVLTRKLDQATGLTAPNLLLDETKLQPGANQIRITSTGQGRLYYSARAEYFSTDEKLQKTGTTSLNILRDYFRLVPGKDGEKIVYDTAPLDGPVTSGDIVAVRLTVTGSEWKYLMVEDPIPAGTEFIERDNSYEMRSRPPWWQYLFTRRELHDDRMALFQTYFPQGQQQYFYLLKVVNPGVFQVSPARVQPMYQPGVMATTENRRLEVK